MITNGFHHNGMKRSLAAISPRLGQPAMENPALTVAFDLLATGTSAMLGMGMVAAKNEQGRFTLWSLFWIAMAAGMGMKTLHDLSRIKPQVTA